ncbi:small nuclear ribonucleoprotein-associated protein B'-like [Macrobrachium rosenbergii]|uniref:small nuclear ribonucleoprotein-associated protein B'-like n=1 Tax=Macrobrachium rosenbergii TaxID=79674 RepID=UPI0034D3A829
MTHEMGDVNQKVAKRRIQAKWNNWRVAGDSPYLSKGKVHQLTEGPRVILGSGPGPGMGRPAGRGTGANLQGPARGVGGPSSQMMQPAARAGPQLNMPGRGVCLVPQRDRPY